jgi:hypothetical protein
VAVVEEVGIEEDTEGGRQVRDIREVEEREEEEGGEEEREEVEEEEEDMIPITEEGVREVVGHEYG